jgi:hypothetical protein
LHLVTRVRPLRCGCDKSHPDYSDRAWPALTPQPKDERESGNAQA